MGIHDPWWNEADRAELDVLLHELVDGIWEHRTKCRSCAVYAEEGYPPCPQIGKAISEVIHFRDRREVELRAIWMRRQRLLLEHDLFKLRLFGVEW